MRLSLFILISAVFCSHISGQWVTKHGQNSTTGTDFVNKRGKISDVPSLSRYGQELKLATITTTAVSSRTDITAISGGNIISDGGSAIIFCGVCWNTTGSPTITDSKTTDVLVSGTFTSSLTGLIPNTKYYVRAYATSWAGTSYGNEISFRTLASPTTSSLLTGLVGYWDLNEVSGDALDILGLHNGTPHSVTQGVVGKIETAYNFVNVSKSYVYCGAIPLSINSFSLWAKRSAEGDNECLIGFGGNHLGLWIGNNKQITLKDNNGLVLATWGVWTDMLTYHHIVLVTSATGVSGKVELFIDGISQGKRSCTIEGISNFVIGNEYANGTFNSTYGFNGNIDEVGLWEKSLTSTEIEDLYSQGVGQTYPFSGIDPLPEVNFFINANSTLLLHSVGDKRVILESVGADQYVKYSNDNGVTYNAGINVTSQFNEYKARILANGNIVVFGINKIYYSDDNLATLHPCNVLNKDGSSYTYHIPVNANYPGKYFGFMGGFIENEGMAVLGNYANTNYGAAPINLYYSLDGITWKVFYTFGQNPSCTDNGTAGGGTGCNLLGDASNTLITKHIHAINIGYDGNYYVSTGEAWTAYGGEAHFLKCVYNGINDTWEVSDLLTTVSRNWPRMRSLGVFERNGFLYWGCDGGEAFTYGGVVYSGFGIYKCAVSDVNDPAKHTRIQQLSDACYSFVNVGNVVFAGLQELHGDDNVYISYDYGETWSSYAKPSWMTGDVYGVWYNELYKLFVTQLGFNITSWLF